jgi:hypothetical protein
MTRNKLLVGALILATLLGAGACNDSPTVNEQECRGGWMADGRCADLRAPTGGPLLDGGGVVGGGGGKSDTIPPNGGNAAPPDSTGGA